MFDSPLQQVVRHDKYAKWLPHFNRRETWDETCHRVIQFLGNDLDDNTWESIPWTDLFRAMRDLEVLPSMRIVQMAGPALERCHVGAYNCAYLPLEGPRDLAELLYILMQGTGCGYSVEQRYIDKWPQVTLTSCMWGNTCEDCRECGRPYPYEIEDSTEGWCDAFLVAITSALRNVNVDFDYSLIRPEGSWLHTKGGRSSGPEPLRQLLKDTYGIIRGRAGMGLTSFDIHRLACKAATIVQVGGVRRSALISLSDLDDLQMRDCKRGQFWLEFPELSQANNSAVYEGETIPDEFDEEWNQLRSSGTGERGIFRRPQRLENRDHSEWGTNPCGEIILRPRQFCNLSQVVARADDTAENLERKVRLATIFGTIQSTLTKFNYLSDEWKKNCDEERLLGVDITGAMDCPIITPDLLRELRSVAEETNKEYAQLLGINQSVSVTCNKPSGNSSQLVNCSSGIHPRYAPYYIRRIRLGSNTALVKYLKGKGMHLEPEGDQTVVASFPIKSPDSAICRKDVTAYGQFAYWLMWKQNWTSHNPSCTIYVRPFEWDRVKEYMRLYWNEIGGLSFLPYDDHVYQLAPYEEISEQQYNYLVSKLPQLDLTQVVEVIDNTTMNRDYACEGDKCLWEPPQNI